tara:strand:+ start:282 stop:854 length:573 start_codon:yes stop_codon:yes gene_type:complete
MANLINADPTAGLKLVSSSSSDIQIQSNGVTVCTINADGLSMNTGTLAGNGPAFSAYTDADTQSISNATWTKVVLDTEEFDTNSNFASSRFTPTVAGYYQINGQTNFGGISASGHQASSLYKNGARYKDGSQNPFDATDGSGSVVSALLYFNGSTDYVELYIFQRSGASRNANVGNIARNYFDGCLVRAA